MSSTTSTAARGEYTETELAGFGWRQEVRFSDAVDAPQIQTDGTFTAERIDVPGTLVAFRLTGPDIALDYAGALLTRYWLYLEGGHFLARIFLSPDTEFDLLSRPGRDPRPLR